MRRWPAAAAATLGILVVVAVAFLHWSAGGRRLRARLAVAATPAWTGEAVLTAPDLDARLLVRWQRPGWWRVDGPGGSSAYDGRTLTVRLPGGPSYAAEGNGLAWADLWPSAALQWAARDSLVFGRGGWPVGWRHGSVAVRYLRVARVPSLPRAAFRLPVSAGAPAPTASAGSGPVGFAPRPAPGLFPEWRVAVHPVDGPAAVVFAYAVAAGTITLAENVGDCSGGPVWVRAPDGWIVHWCAGGLAFTARGPADRPALDRVVQGLREAPADPSAVPPG